MQPKFDRNPVHHQFHVFIQVTSLADTAAFELNDTNKELINTHVNLHLIKL